MIVLVGIALLVLPVACGKTNQPQKRVACCTICPACGQGPTGDRARQFLEHGPTQLLLNSSNDDSDYKIRRLEDKIGDLERKIDDLKNDLWRGKFTR